MDENRQVGYAALPLNHNPYLADFGDPRRASGALRPAPGRYDIVFDSPGAATAGRFTFRYWVNDVAPPTLRVVARTVGRGRPLEIAAADAGSGIDPESTVATVDGTDRAVRHGGARIRIPTTGLAAGRHSLVLQVSDFQETRNNENVPRILPNTRVLRATFTVR